MKIFGGMNYWFDPSRDHALTRAAEHGCNIVPCGSNELQIDIDSEEDYQDYLFNKRNIFNQGGPYQILYEFETFSKSGAPKRHITLGLNKDIGDYERVIYQLFLCSDVKREFFNFRRIQVGAAHPVLFFEKKR